jgi:hypothetical protein
MGGDFNLIYQAEGKNNSNLDRAMMGCFRRFINEVELQVIPLIGRKFSWSNERESPTLVWLDQVFATNAGSAILRLHPTKLGIDDLRSLSTPAKAA